MTLASTRFLINYQTGPMPRPALIPGVLRRDFDPARLQAWLVWLVMWLMTIEDKSEVLRVYRDNTILICTIAGIVLWLGIQNVTARPVYCPLSR